MYTLSRTKIIFNLEHKALHYQETINSATCWSFEIKVTWRGYKSEMSVFCLKIHVKNYDSLHVVACSCIKLMQIFHWVGLLTENGASMSRFLCVAFILLQNTTKAEL